MDEQEANPPPALVNCKNCRTEINGLIFCPTCGQKSDTHVLTLRELLREVADGILDFDSRLWRTLIPLAVSPGKLTNAYLFGKRMYYLPPFRLYLILSVLFFLIPNTDLDFDSGPEEGLATINEEQNSGEQNTTVTLNEEAILIGAGDETGLANQAREELARALALEDEDAELLSDAANCEFPNLTTDALFTLMVRNMCLTMAENSDLLLEQLADSIPVMMIIGIPLVALFMQLIYAFSSRFYVEHVIFLFHVHAFYFLIGILMAFSSLLGQYYTWLFNSMNWFRIVAGFYIPIYIFQAMLKVYGGSKRKTFFKAFILMIGYGTSIGMVMFFGLMYTALSL
jgi:hypothetical protein